jgi:hypothetical protein
MSSSIGGAAETPAAKRRRTGIEAAIALEVEKAVRRVASKIDAAEGEIKVMRISVKNISAETLDVISGALAGLAHLDKVDPANLSAALEKAGLAQQVNVLLDCNNYHFYSRCSVNLKIIYKSKSRGVKVETAVIIWW